MNDKLDELAKNVAQSVTRRGALKKFGVGLVGIVLATLDLADRAEADKGGCFPSNHLCSNDSQCCSGLCLKWGEGTKNPKGHCA